MNRIVIHSRVGADGVLELSVPIGKEESDRDVEVIIEPAQPKSGASADQDEWRQFVSETAYLPSRSASKYFLVCSR